MNVNTALLLLALVGWVWLIVMRFGGKVDPKKAKQLVAEGAVLVDVRSQAEFRSGHIEGAVNLPLSELPSRAQELGNTSTPVVVYCASGTRSRFARSALRKAGFSGVFDLGPMSRWR